MTEDKERDLGWMVEAAVWHRTTHVSPHEYIRRDEYPRLFGMMKERVRVEGYPGRFQGRTYRYANLAGYRYWFMSEGPKSIILNRARLEVGGVQTTLEGVGSD